MAYIGKSPSGSGVRARYYYTAVGGETSISGVDDNGRTLSFTDGEYVDVFVNGVLLVAGTDYGTGTPNTISSITALAADDIVEVLVFDTFSVFSGNFTGNVTVGGAFTSQGIDDNATSTAVTLDSSGNVGIGTSSISAPLHVKSSTGNSKFLLEHTSPSTGTGQVSTFVDGSSNTTVVYDSNGYYRLGTSTNPVNGAGFTERLRILSTGGITFNGDTATANALDDYEEGSWTPVLGGASFTQTGATFSNAKYVKIGSSVFYRFAVTFSGTSGNWSAGDGFYLGSGAPFSNPTSMSAGSCWASTSWLTGGRATGIVMAYASNQTYVGIEQAGTCARSVILYCGVTYYSS